MPEPDFARARRQLRRARVEDALGLPRKVNVALNRNRLLERLAQESDGTAPPSFDDLDEANVDLVVSLAIAEVEETNLDALTVSLMCIRVLAADGQFARLSLIGTRLQSLGERFEVERPYLSAVVESFAAVLRGDYSRARRNLDAILGLRQDQRPPRQLRSRETIDDIVAGAALRSWLVGDGTTFAEKARQIAIQHGSGMLLLMLDVIITYADAAEDADCVRVVTEADPTFQEEKLRNYLDRRSIRTLFPSQLEAVKAGATTDRSLVVALPTSSGKTFVAELRIAAALTRHPGSRAIYIAPYRLLARQVEQSLSKGLRPLGLTVRDIGAGYDPSFEAPRSDSVESGSSNVTLDSPSGLPDVAVCTPERLDALMRLSVAQERGADTAKSMLDSLSVIVFDELQLVGRAGRGARFELLLTRLQWRYPNLGILGLSAASYGTEEIAQWLTDEAPVTGGRRPTGTLELLWQTNGHLVQRVARYAPTRVADIDRSKQSISDAAMLATQFGSIYQPVLIIETSRRLTENVAKRVSELSIAQASEWRDDLTPEQRHEIDAAVQETRMLLGETHPLPDLLRFGIGYHHAGVPSHILRHIENLAAHRLLRVLASTTTVAEGADLPFRVVIIPHLNFASARGRLERDLYLNIVGRAGRATVAVEGLVVLLNSDAANLRDVVRSSLWSDIRADRIRGQLADISSTGVSLEDWNTFHELQSQVLAWLSESGAGLEDQASRFAERTLSWLENVGSDRRRLVRVLDGALQGLEQQGLALAASPLRPTELGKRVSLGGLSAPSAVRLNRVVQAQRDGWLSELTGCYELSKRQAQAMAALVFETTEVLEESLWLRRSTSRQNEDALVITALADGRRAWPYEEQLYSSDIELLAAWISGADYTSIADLAPVFTHRQALFGGDDPAKRASDAAEYIGRLAYPAGWAWSAATVLLGSAGETLPWFLRSAVELGAPTETACILLARGGLTRVGALAVSRRLGGAWASAASQIIEIDESSAVSFGLSELDTERLLSFVARLSN